MWSPSGGALILQGAKPVRLAAGAFLLCVQKEPKYGQGEPGFPLCKPLCRLAVLATDLDFSGEKNPNPYCAQIRSQGSRGRICPHRLAVPEKIFALLACSIFSTAAGAPPRCIRHCRRFADFPDAPFYHTSCNPAARTCTTLLVTSS